MSLGSLHPGMDRDEESPSSAAGVGASHSYLLPGSDELDIESKGFDPDSAWRPGQERSALVRSQRITEVATMQPL